MLLRARDGPGRGVEHVLARHVELVLEMDFRGRDEDMNAGVAGLVDRPQRRIDVLFAGAREAEHDRLGHRLGDSMYRFEVAGRRGGEAGLDDIDVQPLELPRDRDLLLDVHRAARRLLAVAQRRVEDADVVGSGGCPVVSCGHRVLSSLASERTAAPRPRGGRKRKRPGRLSAHRPGRLFQVLSRFVRPAPRRAWRGPL